MLLKFATESYENLKKIAEFQTETGNVSVQGHRM